MRRKPASTQRELVVKAIEVGRDLASTKVQDSAAKQDVTDSNEAWGAAGAIEPPFDPEVLTGLFEVSNSLRPNVDAYAVNIDGFGYRFEPVIDLEQEDAAQRVTDAILIERMHERGADEISEEDLKEEPSADEIAGRMATLRRMARIEKARLESFFASCARGENVRSFVALRKRMRQDIETLGYAFWEVLRNRAGKIARFVYVPGWTIRLRPLIEEPVLVQERVQVSPLKYGYVESRQRFRTYVQQINGTMTFFKAFGDPRVVNRRTGKVYKTLDEFKAEADPQDQPATELFHFSIPSTRTPYGVPRWIGNLISVLGSRSSEEVNYYYFENKSVPPLAVLVSGGRLSKSSVPKIESFIENNLKGKRNFHKILILEAVSPTGRGLEPGTSARPMIEIKPLMEAQQKDALFQRYDERNIDKVGGAFRLPRMLRGDSRDFNRATAESSLRYAENQVFQPERDDFDSFVNGVILPELGIMFWHFKSNSAMARDPDAMSEAVTKAVEKGILTPAEGRVLMGDVFNRDFAVIKEPWTKQPIPFTLAGIQTGQMSANNKALTTGGMGAGILQPAQGQLSREPASFEERDGMSPEELAQDIIRIRNRLGKGLQDAERDRLQAEGTIVVELPAEEMARLVER